MSTPRFVASMPRWSPCLVFVFLTLAGCKSQDSGEATHDRHADIFDSPVIDTFLTAAPQTVIDLDEVPVITLLPDLELGGPQDSMILAREFSFLIAEDSIFFANYGGGIYASGLDGVLQRQIGRLGKGPGEFDILQDFTFNGTYFFTSESSRIQVLSRKFEYAESLPRHAAFPSSFVATGKYLYTGCGRKEEYRICPRSSQPPFEELSPFLPSLNITSPPMDGVSFGATSNGRHLMAAFWGLPYVLVFNEEHEHIHTLRLVGEPVDAHADNYTMGRPGIPGVGLRHFIRYTHVINDSYLAIPLRDVWHFIKIEPVNSFKHVGAARMMTSAKADAKAIVGKSRALLDERSLYVSSTRVPYLVRYPFPF
ncbi:MAG: hypothetical protein OXE92_03470 [Bacteroidetes bacterium]|nr:hypothetical protein [Bacteroidota bacterium]